VRALDYVLKSILDMDKKARSKKIEAENYRKEVYEKIASEKREMTKAELETAKKKIIDIDEGFKKGAEKKLKLIQQKNDEVLTELYEKQKENVDIWVSEMYKRILEAE
jgi:prephenate dehydrogenase